MKTQQVFGCGVDIRIFKSKYESLDKKDQLRLECVARRVWLTVKIRYEMSFYGNPFAQSDEDFTLTDVELPSIEIYLLCTCLDTLAGKPPYIEFDKWLEGQGDVAGLDKKDIVCLYRHYKDEYGTGKNLKRLFKNLPNSVKDWLTNNVVIRRVDKSPVIGQDRDQLVMKLYVFFYEFFRNSFTHSSISRQTNIADDISEFTEGDSGWITPAAYSRFPLYRDRPKQEWTLCYRQGLDLATILRIIITAVALQILNIELTQELISTILRNLSRLNALYSFVNEVSSNSAMLSVLSKADESKASELRNFLFYDGVPVLRSEASSTMAERYNTNLTLEAGMSVMTRQYLSEVGCLNTRIVAFNESNPPPENPRCNSPERWQTIVDFLNNLALTPSYQAIQIWPSKVEMTNIWLIIRDPCYT